MLITNIIPVCDLRVSRWWVWRLCSSEIDAMYLGTHLPSYTRSHRVGKVIYYTHISTTVFKKGSSANWVWISDFWHVQWSCTSSLYFIFSKFDFTQHTTSLMYQQGKRSMFRSVKRFLQETCRPTLPIILITSFCNRKIFILSGSPPHRVKPYLKWTWKHAKYMVLKTYGIITFFKELII
jgi:hypothetical protein